jgi:hypothetical protein
MYIIKASYKILRHSELRGEKVRLNLRRVQVCAATLRFVCGGDSTIDCTSQQLA